MTIALIAAASREWVIGCENALPWHLPEDLQYFKKVTFGKPIIMGRKTFESIGRALPGRYNIVVTRDRNFAASPDVHVANDIQQALTLAEAYLLTSAQAGGEILVIGGGQLYREMLDYATKIYLTMVNISVDGDAFFPILSEEQWQLASDVDAGKEASIPHKYRIYEKRLPLG